MNATPAKNIETGSVVGHFINGKDVSDDNRPLAVSNPATGEVTKHVAMASKATVEEAIAGRAEALPESGPMFEFLRRRFSRRPRGPLGFL